MEYTNLMTFSKPRTIGWNLTYACQLRCTHCYTESGRRSARKLPKGDLLCIADTLVAMQPSYVMIGGGEPLLVPELMDIVERLRAGGLKVWVYTNGLAITERVAEKFADLGVQINVSLDGTTASVHDAIRGRAGAFDATMSSLRILDRVAAARKRRQASALRFSIDVVLVRSNFAQIEDFCTVIAPTFPELALLQLGAVIPTGLAARAEFAKRELLTNEQVEQLADPAFRDRLRGLAPTTVGVAVVDSLFLQFHTQQARRSLITRGSGVMEIEADGGVRAIETYEGVVGNILRDSPDLLWQRCQERSQHPLFVELLTGVRNAEEWAAAVRKLDLHFAAKRELVRLHRRPEFVPDQPLRPLPRSKVSA